MCAWRYQSSQEHKFPKTNRELWQTLERSLSSINDQRLVCRDKLCYFLSWRVPRVTSIASNTDHSCRADNIKSNLSLYSLYYVKACNEFTGPIFASLCLQATQLLLKKCRSGGEPLATLCSSCRADNRHFTLPPPWQTFLHNLHIFRRNR